MQIRPYTPADEAILFNLLSDEGEEWSDYHGPTGRPMYLRALASSHTWIAVEENQVCGFVRCREDDGFGVYVHDLLVRRACRGRQIGRLLLAQVCREYPDQTVYVMSDADPYYEKLGYRREGSIFAVHE